MAQSFTLYSILWYFLLYSFVGWCIEVVFCSANTGRFVNRGFLNGPVCPIYGCGAVLILLLLRPVEHSLPLLFLASVLVTSALELFTGFALKKLFHTSWWDYSDQPFNLGGYICLKFSLAWGLGGVFLVRVLHPAIAGLVGMLPPGLGYVLLAIAIALFLADAIVTVNVILKLNRDLGEITKLAKGLHEGSEAIAKSLGTKAVEASDKLAGLDLEERRGKLTGLLEEQKETAATRLEEQRDKWTGKWDEGKEKLEALLGRHSFSRRRLLNAFPNMQNNRHAGAFAKLREAYPRLKSRQDKNTAKKPPENSANNSTENTPENPDL